MIVVELWRRGLLGRIDREVLRQFFGIRPDPLALSRRFPMWRALSLWRLVASRRYASGVATWLAYRVRLFDGLEG
jgi:hypothetical protein